MSGTQPDEWLTGEQVQALEAERDLLRLERDYIQLRIDEIDRAIVASGESKLRAILRAAELARENER